MTNRHTPPASKATTKATAKLYNQTAGDVLPRFREVVGERYYAPRRYNSWYLEMVEKHLPELIGMEPKQIHRMIELMTDGDGPLYPARLKVMTLALGGYPLYVFTGKGPVRRAVWPAAALADCPKEIDEHERLARKLKAARERRRFSLADVERLLGDGWRNRIYMIETGRKSVERKQRVTLDRFFSLARLYHANILELLSI